MDGIKFLGVLIIIDGKVNANQYDLGAVTLSCEDRTYILDIVSTDISYNNGRTELGCKVEVDKELFNECKYDLTIDDLFNIDLKASIYIGGEYSDEPDSQTLFVKINNLTKAINLELE